MVRQVKADSKSASRQAAILQAEIQAKKPKTTVIQDWFSWRVATC